MYKVTNIIKIVLFFVFIIPSGAAAQEKGLNELLSIALQNNQSIQSSVLDDSIAEERISEVKTNMLPHISISGEYKYYTQLPIQLVPASVMKGPENLYMPFEFGTPWNLSTTISMGQLLYSQEYITGVQLAHTGKELTSLLVHKSKEEVVYNVSAAYYNAQVLNAQLNYVRSNITNMERLISTGELLYENQMIKYIDVEKLKLNKTMLEAQEKTLKASYDELINLLKFLCGISQSNELSINNEISAKTDILPYGNVKPDRIEIKLLKKKKELNELERKNIIAGFIPRLSVYGVYNYTFFAKGGGADLFKGYPASWIGLQLSWNIFDGLERNLKIEQKDIEYRKLNLQMNQLNENINMEMNNAKNQVILQESLILSRKEQLALAEKLYEQTQLQFKEGIVNITDVIQSDSSLREAQNNYIVSVIKLLNAQLSWKKSTGKLINN